VILDPCCNVKLFPVFGSNFLECPTKEAADSVKIFKKVTLILSYVALVGGSSAMI
jgi:hypothetical protein